MDICYSSVCISCVSHTFSYALSYTKTGENTNCITSNSEPQPKLSVMMCDVQRKPMFGLVLWASLWCILTSPKWILSSPQKFHILLLVLQSVIWISGKMFSIKIKCPLGKWQTESTSSTGRSSRVKISFL